MSVKLFNCRYCGRGVYDDQPDVEWEDGQYVHAGCRIVAQQNDDSQNDTQHANTAIALCKEMFSRASYCKTSYSWTVGLNKKMYHQMEEIAQQR